MRQTSYILFTLLIFHVFSKTRCNIKNKIWYPYQFNSGYNNREELVITKVESAKVLKLSCNETVVKWKSVSIKNVSYAIGITRNGLALLKAENNNQTFHTEISCTSLNSSLFDAEIFVYYNKQLKKEEVIILTSIGNPKHANATELIWFKVSAENKLELIWKWNSGKIVYLIKFFKISDAENILFVSKNEDNTKSFVDIYQFSLGNKNYGLIQGFVLENMTNFIATINHHEYTYLAIPQEKQLLIYKYDGKIFILHKTIFTTSITHIISFKISSNSYLAVAGNDTTLYSISNFQRIDTPLNNVDFWLPVITSELGDEKILLVENILNHGTYSSFNIEAFVNSGDRFDLHEEMLCDYHGELSNGLDCIVEETTTSGIKGSAGIYVDGLIGIIVPKKNSHSELFMLHTKIKDARSPIEIKIEDMNQMRKKIEDRLKNQKSKYQEISDSLKYVLKNNEENVISAPWKVDTLKAAAFTQTNLQVMSRNSENSINLNKLKERILNVGERISSIKDKLSHMETISDNYRTIIFKGPVEVLGESSIQNIQTSKFQSENVSDVFSDIARVDDLHKIPSQKFFESLNVGALNFNSINGIPADNLAFGDMNPLNIDGNLVFMEPVLVEEDVMTGKVNDIFVKDSWVQMNEIYNDTVQFDDLNVLNTLNADVANKFPIHKNYNSKTETAEINSNIEEEVFEELYIPGSITVETINGKNLDEIIDDLCLTNINTFIPDSVKIEGELIVENMVKANYLNNLKFPEDYISSKSGGFSNISSQKIFHQVFVKELTTEKLNDIDTDNIITFSQDQYLPGKFVFSNFRVTESLEILGNVSGTNMNELPSNTLITESNTITSNINFKNLEIGGNIIISSSFNGSNLEEVLNNIVYKFENPVEITSVKEFPLGFTSKKNIFLQSNTINNIPIDSFVSKKKDQQLLMRTLNSDVIFDNLLITGTIGGINVTKLEMETVKLSGEQFISSRIVLEDQIKIKDLQILESLNDVRHEDYLYTTTNNSLNLLSFDEIVVESLEIRGNLKGNLENFNLAGFNNSRMSYTLDQLITNDFTIENSKIQNFNTNLINNYQYKTCFDETVYSKKIFEFLFTGKLKVEKLLVKDTLKIASVNGIPMETVLRNCLRSEEDLYKSELSLMDVYFPNLQVEYFNDVKFSDILENLVFKNENLEKIYGHKIYLNGFDVLNFMDVDRLNGIRINNILRKNGVQKLETPLVIEGNVTFANNIQVANGFNGVSFEKVAESFSTLNDETYIIKEDVMFRRLSYINELVVESYVNGENLTDFLENIVNVNEDAKICAPIIFKNDVKIEGNMIVNQKINNVDIESLRENIVLITQDGIIEGLVKFENSVVVNDELVIDNDLVNQFVMGIDLNSWKTNATFIDQGMLEGNITFEEGTINEVLKTTYLNEIDTNTLIPLKTDETIEEPLYFLNASSFSDVIVNNLVNTRKLVPELMNTVMKNKIQEINSNIIFENNVLIENNLFLLGLINGYSINNLITTNYPHNLTAAYTFNEKVTIKGNVGVFGLLNGVNIKEWLINGVSKENMFPQYISLPWNVKENVTFNNDVISGGNLSGLEAYVTAKEVQDKEMFTYSTEHNLKKQYLNMCKEVRASTEVARKNVYKFKYFDFYQFINTPGTIETTFSFQHLGIYYLIISNNNSCNSTIYLWDNDKFTTLLNVTTGSIEQIITVQVNNFTFLITREMHNKNKCLVEGSNIWKFENNDVSLLYKIDDTVLLQESKVPGTFYAMFSGFVIEYKIEATIEPIVTQIRKWVVPTENSAFIPHGLKTGLALRNGKKIFYLKRSNPEDPVSFGYDYNSLVTENYTEIQSIYLPGYSKGEVAVLKVGQHSRRNFAAVTFNEVTTIPNSLDIIKIYEDVVSGKIFHKVPSQKPSSLLSLEFEENGETLLVFIENKMKLQVYEYRGIEGFKHRSSAYLQGEKLLSLKLPFGSDKTPRHFIGAIRKNRLDIIQAIMNGAPTPKPGNLKCIL